jgi:hypothetical protein
MNLLFGTLNDSSRKISLVLVSQYRAPMTRVQPPSCMPYSASVFHKWTHPVIDSLGFCCAAPQQVMSSTPAPSFDGGLTPKEVSLVARGKGDVYLGNGRIRTRGAWDQIPSLGTEEASIHVFPIAHCFISSAPRSWCYYHNQRGRALLAISSRHLPGHPP